MSTNRQSDSKPTVRENGIFRGALNATGLPAMRKRLEKLGIPFRDAVFPDYDLHQVFLRDPDGVKIELNYSASE